VESFHARLRDELLNGEILYTLKEAQIVIESWRRHYNAVRPQGFARLQATGTGGVRACARRVAVCAPSYRSDGHAPAGAKTAVKLTLQLHHSRGPDQ
jgi:hypothetical protein